MPDEFSYPRYLEAKRSVDDRAINRVVWQALREHLPAGAPLRVLEFGGGTGSMVRRCLEWKLAPQSEYVLVDQDAQSIAELPALLVGWAKEKKDRKCVVHPDNSLALASGEEAMQLGLACAEVGEFIAREDTGPYDLIIANAVLDLVDLKTLLPKLWARAAPNAHVWFTINFDGESVFLPPRAGDTEIFEAYHASMDRRTGTRYTGRSLFEALPASGATILASGSSDWVVHAQEQQFFADEAYFLHHIVHTIDRELQGHDKLDGTHFQEWVRLRHEDVREGKLVYIAHQLDFLGRVPGKGSGCV